MSFMIPGSFIRTLLSSYKNCTKRLTEGEVGRDPVSLLHVGNDGAHEVVNLVLAALSATVEVLAGKLSGVDREVVGVVPVLDVFDETFGSNVVIVNGNSLELQRMSITNRLPCESRSLTVQPPLQAFMKLLIQTLPLGLDDVAGEMRV